ncbi:hypothetical protein ACFQDG_15530 [Natronoarchaeum mannanilyticum]|uniref:Uncharacterized protein n=1 Tax=Natronoarchaeum mannanilyticum TaxID=926360 RepID=A0AAV3T400_9EURY
MNAFRTVGRLVEHNYELLVDEARGDGAVARARVYLVFIGFPVFAGVFYGLLAPDWIYFARDFLLVVVTGTGFAVLSLVALSGLPTAASDRSDVDDITRLRTVLGYVILVGIAYVAVGLLDLSLRTAVGSSVRYVGDLYYSSALYRAFVSMDVFAILSYVVLVHYLLFVLVLVGRLYELNVGGDIRDESADVGGNSE